MASSLLSEETETPSGLRSLVERTRTITFADQHDPLSFEQLTDQVGINGRLYTSTFNAATRRITNTSPEGREAVIEIDEQGRTTKYELSGAVYPLFVGYNPRGEVATILQGPGDDPSIDRRYILEYGEHGYVEKITDPMGEWVQHLYDAVGRLTSTKYSDGRLVAFTWDANGNTTSIPPPGRPAHSFNYTPHSLLESYVPPALPDILNVATIFSYNLDKQLEMLQRPDALVVDFEYDAVSGRLVRTALPGLEQISYDYDLATGQVRRIHTIPADITVHRTFDGMLLTSEAWEGEVQGSAGRTYDASFLVQTLNVNSEDFFSATRSNDQDTLVTGVSVSMSAMPSDIDFSVTRDPATGLVTGTTLGSVTTMLAYNGFGELSIYTAHANDTPVYEAIYDSPESPRDKIGRIVEAIETVASTVDSRRYSYDGAGRLIDVWKNDVHISHYTYDDNDNRTSYSNDQGPVITAADIEYDQQDRLTGYGDIVYTYGAEGSLLSRRAGVDVTMYHHDVIGNLSGVTLPDGAQIDYLVDGLGRRIGIKLDGNLTQGFLYVDELNPVAELDENGAVVSVFVYATQQTVPDLMISKKADGTNWIPYRIISDIRGSPRLVVNALSGEVVQEIEYTEFGEIINDTRPGFQPFGFTGGLYDQYTGLTHLGHRDYDPTIGRWTTKDPALFLGGSTNLYNYANGDPVNLVDPTGLGPYSCDPPILSKKIRWKRFKRKWRRKCRRERGRTCIDYPGHYIFVPDPHAPLFPIPQ